MSFPVTNQKLLGQMLLIILASGILAGIANLLHPCRIPWIQDWENYVEAKAEQAGIEIIPLGLAWSLYEEGEHQFVDARSAIEFKKGHIPGAISLPSDELDDYLETMSVLLDSDMPLVVYCTNRECDDALLLALELREFGQSNLFYCVDGFELWEETGCPIVAN